MAADPSSRPDSATWDDVDPVTISKVANRVELVDVRLRMHHVELNADELPIDWSKLVFVLWSPHLGRREDGSFEAHIEFVARMKEGCDPTEEGEAPGYDPEDPPAFEMAASFSLTYELHDGDVTSDDDLEQFCRFNATVNAWPFWRELAQATTLRMGIGPLLVGVLRVPTLPVPNADEPAE